MAAYYNENDPKAAAWLRELIRQGHIAPGEVDTRSILEVRPDDLKGFTQCHFFAGIGVWSYALRLAGWPDDRPVWTGSCPCQPFSVAGKGEGHEDERHLWPAFFGLIREQGPLVVFGEQVADGDGYAWIDDVGDDVESIAYTLGTVCPASCGFGSPDERQRMYWVADSGRGWAERHGFALAGEARGSEGGEDQRQRLRAHAGDGCDALGLADTAGEGPDGRQDAGAVGRAECARASEGYQPAGGGEPQREGAAGRLGNATGPRRERGIEQDVPGARRGREGRGASGPGAAPRGLADTDGGLEGDGDLQRGREHGLGAQDGGAGELDGGERPGPLNGFWRAADWLFCTDGKWRPVEPGSFPLVDEAPARLGRLRGYGNAINAEVAQQFVRAYMSTKTEFSG